MSGVNSKQFNDILEKCLERLQAGGTVQDCLNEYPDLAGELEPLLTTAQSLRQWCAIEPTPAFRDRSRRQFLMAIREAKIEKERRAPLWRPGWIAVPISLLVLLLAGGGTVAAAREAMPDQPLYAVKVATEDTMLTLTRSEAAKAELAANLADKRVHEIVVMAEKGDEENVKKATARLEVHLEQVAALTAVNRAVAATGPKAFSAAPAPKPSTTQAAPRLAAPPAVDSQAAARATPAPTAAPAPSPVPAPAAAPAPAPKSAVTPSPTPSSRATATPRPTRTPTTTVSSRAAAKAGPSPTGSVQPSTTAKDNVKTADKAVKLSQEQKAKLKEALTRQSAQNKAAMTATAKNAPVQVRPALEKALRVVEKRYQEALSNLDDDEDSSK